MPNTVTWMVGGLLLFGLSLVLPWEPSPASQEERAFVQGVMIGRGTILCQVEAFERPWPELSSAHMPRLYQARQQLMAPTLECETLRQVLAQEFMR